MDLERNMSVLRSSQMSCAAIFSRPWRSSHSGQRTISSLSHCRARCPVSLLLYLFSRSRRSCCSGSRALARSPCSLPLYIFSCLQWSSYLCCRGRVAQFRAAIFTRIWRSFSSFAGCPIVPAARRGSQSLAHGGIVVPTAGRSLDCSTAAGRSARFRPISFSFVLELLFWLPGASLRRLPGAVLSSVPQCEWLGGVLDLGGGGLLSLRRGANMLSLSNCRSAEAGGSDSRAS